ncbi:MAG TPA: hypothetical protein VFU93_00485 [Acidimicrobiales bacterium]|nr:hypothetical protein [Acidimicrobiales bacterium]
MTDLELEERVRAALRAVADATPTEVVVRAHSRRTPRLLLIAALVAVAGIAASIVVAVERDDQPTAVTDQPAGPAAVASPLPTGFDVNTANPFFSAEGQAENVVEAYLRDRFPDYPSPGVSMEAPAEEGLVTRVRWSTGSETEGELASGDVFLRQVDGAWGVVATTTDDLDLSDLAYDGDRVIGTVTSTSDESLFVEVRDWRGDFVRQQPERFGGEVGQLDVDVANRLAPTTVRILQVGGTVLSIAEVRFDPSPLPAHRDFERCVTDHTTREKEPTPDILGRLCSDALDGDVIGSGAGGGPAWELIATDEPSGHWVTLRARDQIGTYRISADGDFDSLFLQLGPCCSFAGHVVVAGTLRPGTTGMRVTLGDGTAIAAEGFEDPSTGAVHSIALVPLRLIADDATARVEVRLADGTFEDAGLDLNLAILGG